MRKDGALRCGTPHTPGMALKSWSEFTARAHRNSNSSQSIALPSAHVNHPIHGGWITSRVHEVFDMGRIGWVAALVHWAAVPGKDEELDGGPESAQAARETAPTAHETGEVMAQYRPSFYLCPVTYLLPQAQVLDEVSSIWYICARRGRSVAVNMPACQAGDRGFESRRSRGGYERKSHS